MSVTIWDTNANGGSGGVAADVVTRLVPIDPDDPDAGYTEETVSSTSLARVSDPRWARPNWPAAMRADPAANGAANFKAGWVILDDVLVTPTLGDDEVRGDLGSTPVVDLEAATATWTYAAAAKPLADRQAAMVAAAKAKVGAIVAAGFAYRIPGSPPGDLHTYQIGTADQGNMTSIGGLFALGVTDAHGGFWRDAANVNVTMTQAECEAFFAAAAAYKAAAVRQMWVLIQAVEDAADHAALDLIDIAAGSVDSVGAWPANGS